MDTGKVYVVWENNSQEIYLTFGDVQKTYAELSWSE